MKTIELAKKCKQPAIVGLATKPDFARCMERIEAWFHHAVIDRPPVRFNKHNAQFEAGEPLDPARWASLEERWLDRKSTRLNSSHANRSYAVFCLNKTTSSSIRRRPESFGSTGQRLRRVSPLR